MKEIGLPVFEYEQFEPVWFEADRFQAPSFEVDRFRVPAVDIVFLRRGVIGVSRVGYV